MKETIEIVELRIKVVKKLRNQYGEITSPDAAAKLCQRLIGDRDREHMMVTALDTKNQPTRVEITSIGTLNEAVAHPREMFKMAVFSNAAAILLAHNHPSGQVQPSLEDREVTKRMVAAGRLLGIELLDHIIVGPTGSYFSFRQSGLL